MDGYIVDDYGKIFYRVVGEGKPILFIHGGPGLTHDYFIPYLFDLKKYLMLLNKASFFDERLVCNLFKNMTITKEFMNNFQFINNRILNQYLNQISNYKIDDIMIPTLILNTECDFIPIESSEYIKNRIMNCTVKTIYNSGHYPFIEKTKEFISEINQFVGD